MASYSHVRMLLSAMDLTLRPARIYVWIEALKMAPSSQAMAISACKCADFLLGFIVGKLSDSLWTRWGRRKPWIIICFPIAAASMVFFCAPALLLGTSTQTHAWPQIDEGLSCAAKKTAIEEAIAGGTLFAYNAPGDTSAGTAAVAGAGMLAYFCVFYFAYYAFAWTGTMIPYDALGFELTQDNVERSMLFGWKTAFQFLGYLLPTILMGVTNAMYAKDVSMQYTILSLVFGVWAVLAAINAVLATSERPASKSAQECADRVPLVPTVRRILANKPYLWYLLMRCPVAICSLLPSNLMVYFIKFVMKKENAMGTQMYFTAVTLLGAILAVPVTVWLTRRGFERQKVLAPILATEGAALIAISLLPSGALQTLEPVLYVVMFIVGAALASGFCLPDPMLGDIVDYEELRTGSRNEAMFTIVETNLQQFIEIIGGTLPLVIFQAAGYESNGGCSCGCGIDCDKEEGMSYARWHCPGDIGYACSTELDADLFFGDVGRTAPCTDQNEGVELAIRFFFAFLPGLLALIAIIPLRNMRITFALHDDMVEEVRKREEDPSYVARCALYNEPITPPSNSEESLFEEHFYGFELNFARTVGNFMRRLQTVIVAQIAALTALFIAIVVVMVAAKEENVVTFGCLIFAVILVLVPWNVIRLQAILARGDKVVQTGTPAMVPGRPAM